MADQGSFREQFFTVPNLLSALRLALVPVFFLLLINQRFLWATAVLILAGLTDYLDGYFARKFNQITRLGQLLDPAADRLYIFAALIGLALGSHIPAWLAVVVILRDVMLLITYPVLASHGHGPLPVHFLGKGGTFALLYAIPLLLMADVWSEISQVLVPLAWAFTFWGIGLYWWAGLVYVRQVISVVNSHPGT